MIASYNINDTSIYAIGNNITLKFAAEELARYLKKMAGENAVEGITSKDKYESNGTDALWVGVLDDFGLTSLGVEDIELDDEIYIDVTMGRGIIAGINTRSVLFAVYRFLFEAGCRWVRPGTDGESVPGKNITDITVKIHEKASYRHRGICIEGSNLYENVADMIDWAPKVGFNSYFIQFRTAHTFFERWFQHWNNPLKPAEPFSVDYSQEYTERMVSEIKKRGMLYHAVGHGWTCESFGIPFNGWNKVENEDVPQDFLKYAAEINGKRKMWNNMPLTTNLCYSKPLVRNTMTDCALSYLKIHNRVDYLHFWLADDGNNNCECENCKKANPSDFFVQMLNELDEKLAHAGIHTKIVFLLYVDLLWEPLFEKINNPDRFVMMLAPSRSYSTGFESVEDVEVSAYVRNQLKPLGMNESIAHLKAWQKMFKGDSFDFDYHFMWDHYYDPGYFQISEMVGSDIKNLKKVGLNGLISCQVQRAFLPSGHGLYVMGRTLWDESLEFESLSIDYFINTYGAEGKSCMEYMRRLSEMFDPSYLRREKPEVDTDKAIQFSDIVPVLNEFREVIVRNLGIENKLHALSWEYLLYHVHICELLALMLEKLALGDKETSIKLWNLLKGFIQLNEDALQKVFDVSIFISAIERKTLC